MSTAPAADEHPDPRGFDNDLDRSLAVLIRAKALNAPWLSATDISRILRDEFGVGVHWRTVERALSADSQIAARRKRQNRWEFSVLTPGEQRITNAQSPITVIDPAAAVPAVLNLHAFLGGLQGPIRICDPYFDSATLEHIDACPKGTDIRLLTKNIKDDGTLRRLVAVAKAKFKLVVKKAATTDLHDRYISSQTEMLILGTSLNGFGKKQCFVVKAGQGIKDAITADFDARWAGGITWP